MISSKSARSVQTGLSKKSCSSFPDWTWPRNMKWKHIVGGVRKWEEAGGSAWEKVSTLASLISGYSVCVSVEWKQQRERERVWGVPLPENSTSLFDLCTRPPMFLHCLTYFWLFSVTAVCLTGQMFVVWIPAPAFLWRLCSVPPTILTTYVLHARFTEAFGLSIGVNVGVNGCYSQ